MALITRVARLFRADLHAVLDRLEEPETLLREALREMEDAQGRDEQHLKLLDQALAKAATRAADLRETLDTAAAQLAACIQAAQDDLARAVIRRRLEAEHAVKALERRRSDLGARRTELAARLEENRSRLEAMRQKVETLDVQDAAGVQVGIWDDLDPGVPFSPDLRVQPADVELALIAAKQARQGSQPGGTQP